MTGPTTTGSPATSLILGSGATTTLTASASGSGRIAPGHTMQRTRARTTAAGGTGTTWLKKNTGSPATILRSGTGAGSEATATGLLEQQCPGQRGLALHVP